MMDRIEASGPNAEQIRYWDEVSGPKWVRLGDRIDRQIAPLGLEAIDGARIQSGERVIDVGCGCGQTTLELARRVGPDGHVLGIDISSSMLADARRRIDEAGLGQAEVLCADAQTTDLPEADLVFSRFGVMFFADPIAAFANLRRALRPGGRLVFLCWQRPEKNPWIQVPTAAAALHVPPPEPPPPGGPGPFAFANPDRLREILEAAELMSIEIDSLERALDVAGGESLDETVEFLSQMGPTAALLREADEDTRNAARRSVRDALVPYQRGDRIELGSACWRVRAKRA
jgi:SAM-dependent methyltransferase